MPIIESAYSNEVSATPVAGFAAILYIQGAVNIKTAGLDGSGAASVKTSGTTLQQVTWDSVNSKVVYGDNTQIKKCDIDGSNLATVGTNTNGVWGIDIDPAGDLIVFGDNNGRVKKMVYSTGSVTDLGALARTFHVWFCAENSTWYALSADNSGSLSGIYRIPTDGSAFVKLLATGQTFGDALSIDGVNEKVYWGNNAALMWADIDLSTHAITGSATIYTGTRIRATAPNPYTSELTWADETGDEIRKGALDASGSSQILTDAAGFLDVRLI